MNVGMTDIVRRSFPAEITDLGPDEVQVVISSSALAADGDIWMTAGVDLDRFRANPVWLWDHDPKEPVARSEEISIVGDKIVSRVRFAPSGVSPTADRVRGLVKANILNGISAGALPTRAEPLDAGKGKKGGMRWLEWTLFEASFCAVPVNFQAVVTARSAFHRRGGRWAGAGRDARRLAVAGLAAGVPLSAEERRQRVAELLPPRPEHIGEDALFCSEMAEHLAQRTLLISGRAYREPGPSRAERRMRAAELAECP